MSTVTMHGIERTGPAISAALAAYAPADAERFAIEFRDALTRAVDSLDLAGPQAVLARWHALAIMAANPLTATEQAQVRRARGGDLSGLIVRDEHGSWTSL